MKKTIHTTSEYSEFINTFEGIAITLRHHQSTGVVLIKLDDNFAKANGLRTMEQVYQSAPMLRGYEWLDTRLIEEAREFAANTVS